MRTAFPDLIPEYNAVPVWGFNLGREHFDAVEELLATMGFRAIDVWSHVDDADSGRGGRFTPERRLDWVEDAYRQPDLEVYILRGAVADTPATLQLGNAAMSNTRAIVLLDPAWSGYSLVKRFCESHNIPYAHRVESLLNLIQSAFA